jgi:hypothetical protein
MPAFRVFLLFLVATVLSSCDQHGPPGLTSAADDIKEIKQMIKSVYERILGDRYENSCAAGTLQTQECFYVLKIVKGINKEKFYQAETSRWACIQNQKHGNPLLDCDKFHPVPRLITVFGDPNLEEGKAYDLFGQVKDPPTSQLACHDQNGKVTKTCVERTTELPRPQDS